MVRNKNTQTSICGQQIEKSLLRLFVRISFVFPRFLLAFNRDSLSNGLANHFLRDLNRTPANQIRALQHSIDLFGVIPETPTHERPVLKYTGTAVVSKQVPTRFCCRQPYLALYSRFARRLFVHLNIRQFSFLNHQLLLPQASVP